MSSTMQAVTISVSIESPPQDVYEYAANPANSPEWLTSFCVSARPAEDEWILETAAEGTMGLRYVESNPYGVLDHRIRLETGETFVNPMRVIPNGTGSEVLFTLFRREGVTEAQFKRDAEMVRSDLLSLKRVLEK
ncbi:SRPBCC family protein [Cohnella caldifontis]|uniref:SRPBCC family protein n=1 Tax=Cohnella caldifontis TaxID=3027471 RepID=UPI0023EAE707|nr:SRPBCC family protein [Cohnella sp. YIM B05605]